MTARRSSSPDAVCSLPSNSSIRSIELDDEVITVDATLVAVGNGRSYGGGMLITPGASKSDGLLDLTVVGHGSRLRLVRLFPRVYKGTHVSLDAVQTYRSKKVRLVSEGIIAYADGDRSWPGPHRRHHRTSSMWVERLCSSGQVLPPKSRAEH